MSRSSVESSRIGRTNAVRSPIRGFDCPLITPREQIDVDVHDALREACGSEVFLLPVFDPYERSIYRDIRLEIVFGQFLGLGKRHFSRARKRQPARNFKYSPSCPCVLINQCVDEALIPINRDAGEAALGADHTFSLVRHRANIQAVFLADLVCKVDDMLKRLSNGGPDDFLNPTLVCQFCVAVLEVLGFKFYAPRFWPCVKRLYDATELLHAYLDSAGELFDTEVI